MTKHCCTTEKEKFTPHWTKFALEECPIRYKWIQQWKLDKALPANAFLGNFKTGLPQLLQQTRRGLVVGRFDCGRSDKHKQLLANPPYTDLPQFRQLLFPFPASWPDFPEQFSTAIMKRCEWRNKSKLMNWWNTDHCITHCYFETREAQEIHTKQNICVNFTSHVCFLTHVCVEITTKLLFMTMIRVSFTTHIGYIEQSLIMKRCTKIPIHTQKNQKAFCTPQDTAAAKGEWGVF